MTSTPSAPIVDPVPWAAIVRDGYSYNSILYAIQRLILMQTPRLPRYYLPNFEGITRALYDLGTIIAGNGGSVVPPKPPVAIGTAPPGWNSATSSYDIGLEPLDGELWFDQRQGRLFVAIGQEWFQTNGAEALVHVGPTAPAREATGVEWFNTLDGRSYVYIDATLAGVDAGWFESGPGPYDPPTTP